MDSQHYFGMLREELQKAYSAASEARKKGLDPSDDVEVKIAKDVAARVEGIVGPPGIAETIRSLEAGGMPREDIAFDISRRIAAGEFIKGNKEVLIEQAVRTGLGIITEGVLVAPTEGMSKIRIKQNPDGSNYVAVYYAGPIRSAGGTAAALSLVLADIARRECGIGDYRATDSQIKRYIEEVSVYEGRVSHLQYMPPEEHITVLAGNCPVCIDGDPTEDIEVSAYRGVPGVETDRVRGGVPLVLCEGLAAKAAKVLKYTRRLNLNWDWLEKVIKIKKKADKFEIKPDTTYLEGLVAGRPVFAHASAKGGFRLRYGRSKTNSLMAKNVHPAIMVLLDNFLAFGTQMKIERPGKGCVVAAYDGMEPPVVRLKSGRVMKVKTIKEAKEILPEVAEIMFLGDILCAYGDFLKSNHPLIPSGYCEEWWLKELEAKGLSPPSGEMDAVSMLAFSKLHAVPIHPNFTYHWHDISAMQMRDLAFWLSKGSIKMDGSRIISMSLPEADPAKRALEELLVEHDVKEGNVIIQGDAALVLLSSIGAWSIPETKSSNAQDGSTMESGNETDRNQSNVTDLSGTNQGGTNSIQEPKIDLFAFNNVWNESAKPLDIVNMFIKTKAKAPLYIGARMGRPEKAKERAMDGKPQVLFPTGSFKNRSMTKQYRTLKSREGERTINLEMVRMRCTKCNAVGFYRRCEVCGSPAMIESICQQCGRTVPGPMHCDMKTVQYDERPVDIVALYDTVKSRMDLSPDDVKGVKGLSNPTRIPERLEKGFLRAKHGVFVFRDGTSRFDATDVPLTHFTPDEVGITAEKALSLGYTRDYLGNELKSGNQLLSLRHQDIVLSDNGAEYFMKVTAFIDEMLIGLYGMKPFYNVKAKNDLIGQLAVGLSPHTSAGALCRIIGFTKANVGYGHPYFHTAKRRNCFEGETKLLVHDGKSYRHLTIRELVQDNLIGEPERDDYGTEYTRVSGLRTFSFDNKTSKFGLADITHISRHISPKELIEIKTKSGRKIIVTPDHPFPDRFGNKVAASEAKELLIPWNIADLHSRKHRNAILLPKRWQKNGLFKKNCIGEVFVDKIVSKRYITSKEKYVYNVTVEEHHNLICSGVTACNCDADEDSIMLLMDALLNFSRKYLSEGRGGTMDTPLVLSIEINPKEVDDEAHCIEMVSHYPLEFYEAAERYASPGEVKIRTVKDVLGTEEQFELPLTHPGGSIDEGVIRTAYVELASIPEKIDIQFSLQERIRAVDKRDAAERLIMSHFIPDLYGNLRSFSRQTFRCVNCNTIFRRTPLAGKCSRCGGNLLLTINKGGIEKYLSITSDIVKRYDLPPYLSQRLELLSKEIKSIFEDDQSKQMGLSDFL